MTTSSIISALSILALAVPLVARAEEPMPFRDGSYPSFSPDGQRLASTQGSMLSIVDSKTGKPQKVGAVDRVVIARFSPDGTKLVLGRHAAKGPGMEIWVADADGSHAVRLTREGDGVSHQYPCWTPDSARVIWTRETALWSMKADGSDARALTRNPAGAFEFCGAWSPDGKTLAYIAAQTHDYSGGNPYRIWLLDAASGKQRQLPGADAADHVGWSKDGKWLFGSETQGETLFRIPASGGKGRPAAVLGGGCAGAFAVSPDETYVLYNNDSGPDCPGGLWKSPLRMP